MIAGIVLLLALQGTPSSGQPEQVRLFLGPVPTPEGFVSVNKDFDQTYRDIRGHLKGDKSIRTVIQLVDRLDQADLVLEVVFKGWEDTGIRSGSGTVVGSTAVGSSVPVRRRNIRARLVVRGSEHIVELDGTSGLKLLTYGNEAKNLLKQTFDWVQGNRGVLAKLRGK